MIKELRVDGGQVLKRSRPRSRGMANRILKRTSNVMLVLAPKVDKSEKLKVKNESKFNHHDLHFKFLHFKLLTNYMSHSVHPYSHRLPIIRDWKSRWLAKARVIVVL